ncbi:hypothetical protein ACFOWZ_44845 [Lentzea rhizosphaerae]|uniref:Uncharacterized protein n=1 Tax=Lentzea rhizosphaerae TaxID=2041025 RepID=A0ABV8C950_9PSEU
MTDVRAEVARLYEQHRKLRYPNGQRGVEVAGVELILVDAYAAGCASSWLENDHELDEHVLWLAPFCLDELRKVVPVFADPRSEHYRPYAAHYYGRLLRMVRLITLELVAEVA